VCRQRRIINVHLKKQVKYFVSISPGYLITATNNNSIFLPAAGMKCKDYTSGPTKSFYYWTSNMPQGDDDGTAYEFMGYKDYSSSIMTGSRYYGCPVRAVCK